MKNIYYILRKAIMFIIILPTCMIYSSENSHHQNGNDSIPQYSSLHKIVLLDDSLEQQVFNPMEIKNKEIGHITSFINIKSLYIAIWGVVVALIGAICTFIAFMVQTIHNKKLSADNREERFENKLFFFLTMYKNIVENMEVSNVCKSHKAFNFYFYELQALHYIIQKLNIKNLPNEELISLCMSISLNGITPNSNGNEQDLIYYKYRDILSKEDYFRICQSIEKLKIIDNKKLTQLRNERKLTLFTNYANIQLIEGRRVFWFWGKRWDLIPYMKLIHTSFSYINKYCKSIKHKSEKQKYYYLDLLNSQMSDHELAFLYIFVNSRENNDIGIDIENIEYMVKHTNLPDLYNYKKWNII